jgi:hypothetical protein
MIQYRVSFLGAELANKDLEIKFQDPGYTNTINLVVKAVGRELYSNISPDPREN